MTIKLGIVMDPIHNINYKKDSSLAMLWAAQDLGWSLYYMEPQHLYANQGVAMGLMAPLSVMRDPNYFFEFMVWNAYFIIALYSVNTIFEILSSFADDFCFWSGIFYSSVSRIGSG